MSDKIISLVSGIIFGIGLVISGMTNPEKVIGFLSITHNWDASLIFVMGGGIITAGPFFYLMRNRQTSSLGNQIDLPKKQKLDKKIIIGASLFGVGWGLVGLCPGPAIAAIATFDPIIIMFLLSMAAGVLVKKNIIK
ncbi:YeeE/YedE family protein [Candidatus Pseudothioglobus singularis]|nr:YeeE/YedE family protein [Candidatus Pseudothioglobus singularis]